MKEILLILAPIVIFGILVTGGLQITDPQKVGPVSSFFTDLVDQQFEERKTLQIRALGRAGAITPSPILPPGTTPSPAGPTPTTPPFATQPPLPTNRPTHTPTPRPQCKATPFIALNILVDESGTTLTASRIQEIKIGIKKIAALLRDDDVIGIQALSSPRVNGGGSAVREVVPIRRYADNKNVLNSRVDTLGNSGDTHIKDGFVFARNAINSAKGSFPNRTWILIFLSDGIPNDQNVPGEGPDSSQDPRPFNQQVNPIVSRVASIWIHPGLFGPNQEPYAVNLMQSLAFGPGQNYYAALSSNDIPARWTEVINSVCKP